MMLDKIKELIEYNSEGHSLDFKREQYLLGQNSKKYELLKDISAMANHPSNEDKYIIIGIVEKNGLASDFIPLENIEDEAKYQEYIKSNIEPEINFEYKSFYYNGCRLAYFRVFDNDNRPYLFKNEIVEENKIKYHKGAMVIRIGTKTDRVNRAKLDEIYEAKYSQKDRKSDVKLSCNIKDGFLEYGNTKWDVKFLELSVENISNKSISFLADLRIEKNSTFDIETQYNVQHKIREYKIANSNYIQYSNYIEQPILNWGAIKIADSNKYRTVSRIKNRTYEKEITIPQKAIKADVFEGDLILIIKEQKITFEVEVKLSSDDFTSGPLIKKIEIEVEKD